MAPWDEFPYFDTPSITGFTIPAGNETQLVGTNPMRIALIFSTASAGGSIAIAPVSSPIGAAAGGLYISSSAPFLITQKDFGSLVQLQWRARNNSAAPQIVTVCDIKLLRWNNADQPTDAAVLIALAQRLGLRLKGSE